MKNIIIYGGNFDPIHNGHLNMARVASDKLNAEVFFVPAKVAIWKQRSDIDLNDKLELIKLAIKSANNDRLHLDTYEIDSKSDVNYSIDTVRHFKNKYPDANLFFLIGTDQVNKFHLWKNAEEIASLVKLVYFSRPGFELDENNLFKFHMENIEGEMVEADSTSIREGKSLNIPLEEIEYIVEHNLYFINKIKSLLSEKRFQHSVSVGRLAYEIAVSNHLDNPGKYYLTGLLHDIGKYIPDDESKKIMAEHYFQYKDFPRPIIHQFVGVEIAKKEFGFVEKDILEAINYHTTGNVNMSQLAKIIYASDKIEPTRGFDSKDLIEEMKKDYQKGFLAVLRANKEYFISKNIPYDNYLTAQCMEYYLK